MSQANKKLLQYLNEAHASELGLVRVLQSQIAMTPQGRYRNALEKHLSQRATTPSGCGAACASSARAATRSRPASGSQRR